MCVSAASRLACTSQNKNLENFVGPRGSLVSYALEVESAYR